MSKKNSNETDDFFMSADGDQISMIAEIATESENDTQQVEFEKEIPVLALRNMVLFPFVVMPISIARTSSLKLVNNAFKKKHPDRKSVV